MSIKVNSLTTTANAVYTSSGNTVITSLTLCNYSNGNVTANLFVVPYFVANASPGTPSDLNIALSNVLIASGDTLQMYVASEKILLGPGDAICCNASSNTAITSVTSYTSL